MKTLSYCSRCKENSVITVIYVRKRDGIKTRTEYCVNKGCGHRQELPFYKGVYIYNRQEAQAGKAVPVN